jgi:hypothetical protein
LCTDPDVDVMGYAWMEEEALTGIVVMAHNTRGKNMFIVGDVREETPK